jgi:hypothetical protein
VTRTWSMPGRMGCRRFRATGEYIFALDLSSAFVTAAAQRVDNQMTSSAYLVVWPLRLTHSTAGTKS